MIEIFDDDDDKAVKKNESGTDMKKKDSITSKTVKIYVSGIKEATKASDLQKFFKKSASTNILDAKIIRFSKIPNECFGLVTVENEPQASKCIENLNHTKLNGVVVTLSKVSVILDGIVQKKEYSAIFTYLNFNIFHDLHLAITIENTNDRFKGK